MIFGLIIGLELCIFLFIVFIRFKRSTKPKGNTIELAIYYLVYLFPIIFIISSFIILINVIVGFSLIIASIASMFISELPIRHWKIGIKEIYKKQKKKNRKACPLKLKDWLQFLIAKQNKIETGYYAKQQSLYTIMITILTIMNIGLAISIVMDALLEKTADKINEWSIIAFLIAIVLILGALIYYYFRFYSVGKLYRNLNKEIDELINDIINGDIKDTKKIRERYMKTVQKEEGAQQKMEKVIRY